MSALLDQLRQLHVDLKHLVEHDSEQEVTGVAHELLDFVITEARAALPTDSTLRDQIADLTYEAIVNRHEQVRAADAVVIVGQLLAVLEHNQDGPGQGADVEEAQAPVQHLPATVLDHLSPIHRSGRLDDEPHLYLAAGCAAPRAATVERGAHVLGRDFRSDFHRLLVESEFTAALAVWETVGGNDDPSRWQLAKPTSSAHATYEWGANPYETDRPVSAQATFSRESFHVRGATTLAVHLGLRRGLTGEQKVSWNDVYWYVDQLLQLTASAECQRLFVAGGAEPLVTGPAIFIGDGRSDIADFIDCSTLHRIPGASTYGFQVVSAPEPSMVDGEEARCEFIRRAVERLLLDTGFEDGELLAKSLPT